MTRKKLRVAYIIIVTIYSVALGAGIFLYYHVSKDEYQIFKDSIPFIIAIPAAYLGFCFQKRSSFLQTLRTLWTNLIGSVNAALQYTHLEEATKDQYAATLVSLSKAIDEFRGVYKNINEKHDGVGLFPFECLKEIYKAISKLGYGKLDDKLSIQCRQKIVKDWKILTKTFLAEFDRSEPTEFDSPYV